MHTGIENNEIKLLIKISQMSDRLGTRVFNKECSKEQKLERIFSISVNIIQYYCGNIFYIFSVAKSIKVNHCRTKSCFNFAWKRVLTTS